MSQEEKGKEEENFEGNPEIFFSNLVRLSHATEEEVSIDFCIKNSKNNTVTVTHRVFVTMGHFFRLRDMLNSVCEQIIQQRKETEQKKEE